MNTLKDKILKVNKENIDKIKQEEKIARKEERIEKISNFVKNAKDSISDVISPSMVFVYLKMSDMHFKGNARNEYKEYLKFAEEKKSEIGSIDTIVKRDGLANKVINTECILYTDHGPLIRNVEEITSKGSSISYKYDYKGFFSNKDGNYEFRSIEIIEQSGVGVEYGDCVRYSTSGYVLNPQSCKVLEDMSEISKDERGDFYCVSEGSTLVGIETMKEFLEIERAMQHQGNTQPVDESIAEQ